MGDTLDDIRAEQRQRWEANQAEETRKAKEQAFFEMDRMPEPQQSVAAKSIPAAPAADTTAPQKANKASRNFDARTPASASSAEIVAVPRAVAAPLSRSGNEASQYQPNGPPAKYRPPDAAQQERVQPARPTTGMGSASSSNAPWIPGDAQQEAHPVVVEGNAVDLPLCGCGMPGEGGAGEQIFALAGLHAPSQDSFEVFFHEWFVQEHFPAMSQALQRELVQRARSKSFFSGLASQVKKWAMANTDVRLQADVWCSYFVQNTPPSFRSYGCVRSAAVNLGSQVAPCHVIFLGLPDKPDHWVVAPWASLEVDCSALLDELDGRGGMAALLAAAA